jgi:EmrB/QacA subfamily drug resistance transporter
MTQRNEKFGMVLPIILLSYFMIVLDNSIIFTSTVKIAVDLQLNAQLLSWVSTAYALTFGGLLLAAGRMGDLLGRKRMFMIGLVIFSVASLLVGLSVNGTMIIAMRAIQGIGSAILAPTTLALLMDSYTGKIRMRAIAAYGATAGIGASFGLVIGGLIASLWTWRIGFFINVPVGIGLFLLAAKFVVARKPLAVGSIDVSGTILSVIGLAALVYAIVGDSYRMIAAIVAVVMLGSFVLVEKYKQRPMMPLRIFVDIERSMAYVSRFFFMAAMMSYWFLTPQAMQHVFGFTPLMAGIAFLPMTLPQFFAALQTSRLTSRMGNAKLLVLGVAITLLGTLLATVIGVQTGYGWAIALPMVFLGIGQGFSLSPLTVSGIANTDPEIAGAASGVVNMIHQIGGSVGLALTVAVSTAWTSYAASYRVATAMVTGYLVISLIAAIVIVKKK